VTVAAPARRLARGDLDHSLTHSRDAWRDLAGAHVFITGATGFVGSWLLETLLHAEDALRGGVRATVLVRDTAAFRARLPHLAESKHVRTRIGDVREITAARGDFTHLVHCASAATPAMNRDHPDDVVDLIVRGSERTLNAAAQAGAARFLMLSSGSVYGPAATAAATIKEDAARAARADVPAQRFGAAKADAEKMGEARAAQIGFVVARVFGLVGPRLPLDGQFALGQFFGDALTGRPIAINGDGMPVRSWMHASDLAAWCWTLLARGTPGRAYNVGSEEACAISDAAREVAALRHPALEVTIAKGRGTGAPDRYVPSIARARNELGLDAWTSRGDALRRTWDWLTERDS
jgi:dTDP-glucose 4,6-dehydratase